MAITVDTARQTRGVDLSYDSFPVSGSTSILQGALVGVDSNGLAVNAADSASITGVGVAVAAADNSAGANSAIRVDVYTIGEVALGYTGSPVYGSKAYAADNGSVGPSGSVTNGVYIGTFKESHEALATTKWVQLDRPQRTTTPVA